MNTFKCVDKNFTTPAQFGSQSSNKIILNIADFDCKYDYITKDFRKTLSADKFPQIHISFGKFSDVVRGKQFKKAFELPFGSDLSLGETIILQLDDDNLSDMTDMKWELYDATTNDLLTTQKASRLIYLLKRRTTYSAKLSYTINGQVFEKLQTGICLVK
jgi:hypothetical protein